jgi:hypothetical protein
VSNRARPTSSHHHKRPKSERRARGEIRCGLRPTRLPPREHQPKSENKDTAIDLHLSTADHHTVGIHPRVNIGLAGWVKFGLAPTIETTQIYLDANLELKEKMLAKTTPPGGKPGLFQPDDKLLAFLKNL